MVTPRKRTLARELAAVFGGGATGAAVLAAGLALGRPATADKAAPAPLLGAPRAIGEGHDEVSLGDGFELHGVPTRLSVFWTDDSTEDVAALYERTWSAAGLEVSRRTMDRVTNVTAVESDTGVMRGVSIIETGEDRLVVPSMSTVTTLPDVSAVNAPVPLPEGMQAFNAHRADDGNRVSWVGTFVAPFDPATVAAFYEHALGERGYTVERSAPASRDGVRTVEATRGEERVTISATDTSEGHPTKKGSMVYVDHVRRLEFAE